MLCLQGFAVKPLLRDTFPGNDTAPGSSYLVLAHHLLQEIFSLLLPLGDGLQLLTGFIVLCQQMAAVSGRMI